LVALRIWFFREPLIEIQGALMRARILAVLLALPAVLVFSQTSGDWYNGKPVKDVIFDGLKNVSASELRGIVAPYIGKPFDDNLFWELQGRLYALDYFELISPSAIPVDATMQALILKFTVTEKPVITKILFSGISGIRRAELLDTVSIKTGDVINNMKLRSDEQAIRNLYLEKGYTAVSLRTETNLLEDGSLELVFVIDEGNQVTIEAIRFEGNSAFSERSLRSLLTLKVKNFLNDGAFQEAKLNADKESILRYYGERGYVDAQIIDVGQESRDDEQGKSFLTLVFKIVEGNQFSFGGISFEGNKIFKTEQLAELVSLKAGQLLNKSRLLGDFQRVADLYYENGYIFNTISQREIRDADQNLISYVITIVERGRAHIENIIINGNEKTKESVILREIPLRSGDIFSKTKVMNALRNLYNLQYFSNVNIDTPQGSADSLMDLVFEVEEQSTSDIQFGVTFSGVSSADSFPVSGLIKWNDRNFLGRGNIFGIELNFAQEVQKLVFEYTQKWLFGLPLSGGFDFTVQHSTSKALQDILYPIFIGTEDGAFPDGFDNYDDYQNNTIDEEFLMQYDDWDMSVGFSTGYRFYTPVGNLGLGGGLRSGLQKSSYDNVLYRPFDPALREGNNEWLWSNSIWTSISLDQRDIYYDPSKGYYLTQRLNFVGMFNFEKEHYLRSDTKGELFFTLLDIPLSETFNFKTVFGVHSGLSLLLPQFYGDPVVKPANKLYIDGMFNARGWTGERAKKGMAMWNNWAELRIPLAPNVLSLDLFMDATVVKETTQDMFTSLSIDDFRFSFGTGLRFSMMQFPFRFSLAKRFKVDDGTVNWQRGTLWSTGDANDFWSSGFDFVLSIAVSTY
jgi:outer membrane protein insertion porin family